MQCAWPHGVSPGGDVHVILELGPNGVAWQEVQVGAVEKHAADLQWPHETQVNSQVLTCSGHMKLVDSQVQTVSTSQQ